ncbi:MAG: hypothetical protein HOP10_00510 [Chitinophagaceae bacterium]|nr:hypothetical protein [Chitinophagaceae bacterium]
MKKFLSLPLGTIIRFITTISIIGTILYACKKTDSRQDESLGLIEQKFFYYRPSSEPHVQALTAFMKRVNNKDHFVEKTVRQIGYPYWDKSISIKGISDDRSTSDSAIITYIPFVRERENYVNACLIIKAT